MKKFLPWIFHHTSKAHIYQPKKDQEKIDPVPQVMKINGQQMGIAQCENLRFRVHPYCKHKIGGLLRSSKEDREALKKCKALNDIKTKPVQRKNKTNKNKYKKRKKKRKVRSKNQRSKSKRRRRRRRKLKIVYK